MLNSWHGLGVLTICERVCRDVMHVGQVFIAAARCSEATCLGTPLGHSASGGPDYD